VVVSSPALETPHHPGTLPERPGDCSGGHAPDAARTGKGARALERAATWISAACAVHCMLVPVASALVPLVGVGSQASHLNERYEDWLHLLVVAGGLLSLLVGYRRHREARIAAAMGLGIALYLVGHAAEQAWYGMLISVAGGLGLAAASFWSARRGHAHAHGEHCAH
jgi:hypothetical protein